MAQGIEKLAKAMEVFSHIYAELPLQQISLFLEIAKQEGVTMPELTKILDMPQGTLSRNVKALGVYLKDSPDSPGTKVKLGHDLVETRPDLYNRKSLAVYLTQRGKEVVQQLDEIIH